VSSDASNLKCDDQTRWRPWPEGNPVVAYKRKLIEVAIPLAAINEQSAREKSIRHGHPSTLHLWWARRPLATARAVLFSQLVDDPGENLAEYSAEAIGRGEADVEQWASRRVIQERQRLFDLIVRMVDWDNLGDDALFEQVRGEILKSTGGTPPAILDPFAGGGTIPLEAQRLGLEAHASDLNPVAVLINKALIEIPPKFAGRPPIYPGANVERNSWPKASGLAADVRHYGNWIRSRAEDRIGHLYPKAHLPGGAEGTVIAWIWARTVTCPNPACRIEMPLVSSWLLGKKKNKEAHVVPRVENGVVKFSIASGLSSGGKGEAKGTVARTGAICVSCQATASLDYIRHQGRSVGLGAVLMATVAEGNRQRIYLAPDDDSRAAADVPRPVGALSGDLGYYPRDIKAPIYGLTTFASLFTNRQMTALITFSDLVEEAREAALKDAVGAGLPVGERLEEGGSGAAAYADAIATYLGLAVSRSTDRSSSLSSWDSSRDSIRNTFGRQAIPMVWDFAEANLLSGSSGNFLGQVQWTAESIDSWAGAGSGEATQADASSRPLDGYVISTDPPYYDNIGYSDLSDYFYVWLRRSLRGVHPKLLSTMLVPKAEELVANPHRHGGDDGAKHFFEIGFANVFRHARESANADFPITVYYAFKQAESDLGGTVSTGWETILSSMVHAGWTVTATWPVRSELSNRMMASGMNSLASSVVLALRPRPDGAPTTDRRGFIAALKRELAPALRDLQSGGIAPVDLPQAAIGPGMAVFSRYSSVVESDGSPMPVRAALAHINEMLDEVLTEQEGDFDAITRFALAWYRGHGYESAPYGDAEDLARARGTAVSMMERSGILTARAGRVQLFSPSTLDEEYDVLADSQTSAWEALHHAIRVLNKTGISAAGAFLRTASQRADGAVDLDLVKELAYLVFQVAEKSGWSKDAQGFNDIATSWGDLMQGEQPTLGASTAVTLDFEEDE
jgi:putative DNA methylase